MSGERRAYLDSSPGEARAVVTLDGRPERLLIAWEDDPEPRLGARYAARVEAVSARLGLARLDLGEGPATLRWPRASPPAAVGERLEVEVLVEAGRGKPPLVRRLGPSGERPGLLAPPPDLAATLAALGFDAPEGGERAREMADDAEAQALAPAWVAGGGLTVTVEPTRALAAVDLDLAETGAPAAAERANLRGVREAARLLRLKSIGGLAAIDLIGFPRDGCPLQAAAAEAFAPDGADVALASVSRFGVLQVARPAGRQPLHERLLAPDASYPARARAPRALAHAMLRALARQGRFDPGARMEARCTPAVAEAARPWIARLGPRFSLRADLGAGHSAYDIRTL